MTAAGREAGEDPYYVHAYRVALDTGAMKLLDPGDATHVLALQVCAGALLDRTGDLLHVTPVWAEMEDDLILINTSEASAKARHVSKDPRVGISLVDQFNPYNMVTIKGRVVKITNEGADEHLQKLAKRYLGIGKYYYRKPKDKRVIIKVKPDKVTGLSGHPAFYFLAYLPRDEK